MYIKIEFLVLAPKNTWCTTKVRNPILLGNAGFYTMYYKIIAACEYTLSTNQLELNAHSFATHSI